MSAGRGVCGRSAGREGAQVGNKRETGSYYEEKAAAFLRNSGYEILERNYRDKNGEIDLIARDGKYLVFVEVKYRGSLEKGWPEEAVNLQKQRKIRQVAMYFLYSRGYPEDTPCRFDVVGILGDRIRLTKDAF